MKKQAAAQCNSQQNRLKLIQQNAKLNKQIHILQQKMSSVIQLDIKGVIEDDKKKSQVKVKFNQITMQQSYIKKLKTKLKDLKALNLLDVSKGIVNQQNQLLAMKRQYEKLIEEKKILNKKCDDKKNALQYNNPLNEFKCETEIQLAKIKKKNAEMSAKIIQLQREIRKYHKYQQLNKKFKDQKVVIQNPEYQFSKIDHQKMNLLKKGKLIQQKWKPQIQGLDKQYFESKQNLLRKDRIIKELQKQLKNWQNRSTAVRNQSDVILDRERLSKVVAMSPLKKQNIQKSPDKSKQKKKQQSGIVDFFKNLFSKNNENQAEKPNNNNSSLELKQDKPEIRKWNNLAVAQTRYGTQSQKIRLSEQQKYNITKLSQKNQFIKSKHSFVGFDMKNINNKNQNLIPNNKNKILSNSVAVGTSFYYNDDQ